MNGHVRFCLFASVHAVAGVGSVMALFALSQLAAARANFLYVLLILPITVAALFHNSATCLIMRHPVPKLSRVSQKSAQNGSFGTKPRSA